MLYYYIYIYFPKDNVLGLRFQGFLSFLPHKKFDILCKLSSFFSCHYELGILGTHNSNSASAQYANIQKNVQFRETGRNVSIVKLARSSYFRIIHLYPLAGLFEIFVHVMAAQTFISQAGPKFKTVSQRV